MSEYAGSVDIRTITPHQNKYPTVHKTFESLKAGESMELINDHEMSHLFKYKFVLDFPDQYEWHYIEEGPEVWRAAVTKLK